jgi:hypothetical protein
MVMLITLLVTACKAAPKVSLTTLPAQTPTLQPGNTLAVPSQTSGVVPETQAPAQIPPKPQTNGSVAGALPEIAVSIPGQYQSLDSELGFDLAHFESTLDQNWNHSLANTTFAAEEAFANGNVGEGLLAPNMMNNNRLLLDRLQALGVKGVVLAIKFPLLKPDFPRSSDYLQFFKDIVAECHQRNLKVLVECGAIFAGTPYSPVVVDWSKYTTATFLQGLQDQLALIAKEVKPDYLTLANEPTTEEELTHLNITSTVWGAFVASSLKNIDRASGLLVGAGTGTWENPAYIDQLFSMAGLDYIDLHIYPLNTDGAWLDLALKWATKAHASGKRVTISESWLYKAASSELGSGGLGNAELIMNRDFYSFWSPLDERFIQDIMELSDAARIDFTSFFWMRNFYAYLDYDSTPSNLSTVELNRLITQASSNNIQTGTLSPLGKYFQQEVVSRAK